VDALDLFYGRYLVLAMVIGLVANYVLEMTYSRLSCKW